MCESSKGKRLQLRRVMTLKPRGLTSWKKKLRGSSYTIFCHIIKLLIHRNRLQAANWELKKTVKALESRRF